MQMAWGANAGIQLMREVADNVKGHGGIIMNTARAADMGLADGDLVEVGSPVGTTRGRLVLRQGIRPDTIHMIGQFGHWATPHAKDTGVPSMNALVPMIMDLVDATGSGADLVKVSVTRLRDGA
jgi:phenylacetyl-CoA:acceptor oxidoreductase